MAKLRSINCDGVQIPLSIPIEIDLPEFINDDEMSPMKRQYLLLFNIIQEQLKILNSDVGE